MTRLPASYLQTISQDATGHPTGHPEGTEGGGGSISIPKQSYPRLTGPYMRGRFGRKVHVWGWCKAWQCWIAVCGAVGKHTEPRDDKRVKECERCLAVEEVQGE